MNHTDKLTVLLKLYDWFTGQLTNYLTILWRITVAAAGLSFVLVGWFVTASGDVALKSKCFLTVAVIVVFGFLLYYAYSIRYSFMDRAKVVKRLDEALQLYDRDVYMEKSVLPSHYKPGPGWKWKEPLFPASFILLTILGLLCLATVWLV